MDGIIMGYNKGNHAHLAWRPTMTLEQIIKELEKAIAYSRNQYDIGLFSAKEYMESIASIVKHSQGESADLKDTYES